MNRTIKFRLWCPEESEMEYDVRVTGDDISFNDALCSKERFLMQSISQKDIHSKEIFEGDICQFGDYDEHTYGLIKWDEASCSFKYFYDETTYFHLDDEPYQEMEIIGNIYEISDKELKEIKLEWGRF